MTKVLEHAIQTIRELPEDRQDLVANQLLRLISFEDDTPTRDTE